MNIYKRDNDYWICQTAQLDASERLSVNAETSAAGLVPYIEKYWPPRGEGVGGGVAQERLVWGRPGLEGSAGDTNWTRI